ERGRSQTVRERDKERVQRLPRPKQQEAIQYYAQKRRRNGADKKSGNDKRGKIAHTVADKPAPIWIERFGETAVCVQALRDAVGERIPAEKFIGRINEGCQKRCRGRFVAVIVSLEKSIIAGILVIRVNRKCPLVHHCQSNIHARIDI